MPSRVGTVPATPEFLAALRGLTATYGIVLIFDEVITLAWLHGVEVRPYESPAPVGSTGAFVTCARGELNPHALSGTRT